MYYCSRSCTGMRLHLRHANPEHAGKHGLLPRAIPVLCVPGAVCVKAADGLGR